MSGENQTPETETKPAAEEAAKTRQSSSASESFDTTTDTTGGEATGPTDLTEDELDMLTPEERAIVEGKDPDAESTPDDKPSEEGKEAASENDDAAKAEAAKAAEAEETAKAEEEAAATADAEAKAQPADGETPYDLPAPVDLTEVNAKIAEAEKAKEKAWDDFDNGEIDEAEYKKALKEADEAAIEAERDKTRAEVRHEDAMNTFQDAWKGTVKQYAAQVPELFSDDHADQYNVHVKQVNASESPEIQALSMQKRLRVAHARYAAEAEATGKKVPALPSDTPPKADPKPEDKQSAEEKATQAALKAVEDGKKPAPAATLRDLPAEEANAPDAGQYAAVDQIIDSGDVHKAEAAMAKMSDEELDAYLAAG